LHLFYTFLTHRPAPARNVCGMKTYHSVSSKELTRPIVLRARTGAPETARSIVVKLLALLTLLGAGASNALASDPIGIYAIVDKVVFEPNETSPERVQIRGAFAIAEGNGYTYKQAERGYLYYKLNPDKASACRNEWSDLKSVAGTGQIVAFGSRYGEKGKLRKADAKTADPDVYPVAMGLHKIREERDYEPFKQLAKLRDQKPKKEGNAHADGKP
jgi:hypothetical protein